MTSQLDALRGGDDYAAGENDFRPPDGSGVVVYRTSLPAGRYRRPASDDVALQLQQTSGALTKIDHGVRFACTTRIGNLALAPRHVDLSYDMTSAASFIGAVLPSRLLRVALGGVSDTESIDFGWLHGSSFADETAAALLRRLWSEASSNVSMSRLLTDSIWTALALILQSRSQRKDGLAPPSALPDCPNAVSDWRIRRTLEHIEARIAGDVGLDELAHEVRLSRRQYTTMFRAALGMSPHQWLTRRRVDRACQMLRTTRLSITEIAHACGFSSPQHFATVFRHHRHVTPAAFRREGR